MNKQTRIAITCFAMLTVALLPFNPVEAKKPPGPGGGGGGTPPEGLIYFRYRDQVWTMNAEGGDKTPIPNTTLVYGSPSRLIHGGRDWFLEIDFQFDDEFYPDFELDQYGDPILDEFGNPVVKYGAERKEIAVVNDTGAVILLTTQTDLEVLAQPVWGIDDEYVSWVARRWDTDPDSPMFGTVLEGGLYVGMLAFDNNGNIIGLQQQPDAPLVPAPLVPSRVMRNSAVPTLAPDMNDHSWSPDGARFVFDVHTAAELWIYDLFAPEGEAVRLLTDVHSGNDLIRPRWSPAGDTILFEDAHITGAICTINVNGTGLTTIADGNSRRPVFWPFWSPTGSHVLFQRGDYRVGESNIIRSTATGQSPTTLTRDIFGDGWDQTSRGWR